MSCNLLGLTLAARKGGHHDVCPNWPGGFHYFCICHFNGEDVVMVVKNCQPNPFDNPVLPMPDGIMTSN